MSIGEVAPCFLYETSFPSWYGPADLTDKMYFSMSIDLAGQNLILKDLQKVDEGSTLAFKLNKIDDKSDQLTSKLSQGNFKFKKLKDNRQD